MLEEAVEEITATLKPNRLGVVCQMELPRIWSDFTDRLNERILGANLRRSSSSFLAAVVVVIICTVMSKRSNFI